MHRAILVVEFASTRSPHNYQFRLLLIRLYLAIGASELATYSRQMYIDYSTTGAHSLAKHHYRQLHVRSLQHETLSHFIMDRATTWCIASDGDLGMIQDALDAGQIYQDNIVEVGLPAQCYMTATNRITFRPRKC
jgi:N-terminal acetyltransferase B complex non-catalytic subunit